MVASKSKFKSNRLTIMGAIATAAATFALAVPAVNSQGRSTIKIDGSSTVYPITEAVAEEFQKEQRGAVQVTVGISGTGGGFKKFCSGQTDISDASRPIKDSEKEKCAAAGIEYIELPVAYDAITVVVNKSNPINSMSVAELKKMWEPAAEGTITKWNQVNPSWPDASLALFGPGADSGTFDYFTKAINGESQASRSDFTPSEDDNVLVLGVENNPTALAYFGYSYYEENKDKLKAIAIDGGSGPVTPSATTVRNGSYKPLSRPVFIYVSAKAAERPEVKQFVEFYLNNASALVPEVGSVPLSDADYQKSMARFQSRTTGSAAANR
ncbi:MAG: PstS family phosphate ABC transporter substrate-binding protein [Symploca sp. SIO1C4]|uniref:Phosphate-binding protein n=1 Tax=Symploca sp. SIO1C4 TaxID=2607765 RepID=A0A6B3NIU3_9CYAN|nr:PstS family phosphate ABC transporter substrate-binding protein [Symploca sp. SIO1C4]NET05038.1 PstS family phosphate ABC transporter substrate-binding protein [Symploca sp. SIO2B6]